MCYTLIRDRIDNMNVDYIRSRIKDKKSLILFDNAYEFASKRLMGVVYNENQSLMNYLLEIVSILLDYNVDIDTIISSILCETINYGVSSEEIENTFGTKVKNITSSIFYMVDIDYSDPYIVKEMYDMEEKNRAFFVVLARRLYSLQDIKNNKKSLASETIDYMIPIARKLNLNNISNSLEDICLFYLDPEEYKKIILRLGTNVFENSNNLKNGITKLLSDNGISFDIKSSIKNIYSIYKKMMSGYSLDSDIYVSTFRLFIDSEDNDNVVSLFGNNYGYLTTCDFGYQSYVRDESGIGYVIQIINIPLKECKKHF